MRLSNCVSLFQTSTAQRVGDPLRRTGETNPEEVIRLVATAGFKVDPRKMEGVTSRTPRASRELQKIFANGQWGAAIALSYLLQIAALGRVDAVSEARHSRIDFRVAGECRVRAITCEDRGTTFWNRNVNAPQPCYSSHVHNGVAFVSNNPIVPPHGSSVPLSKRLSNAKHAL